jgi:hypothetical protein
MKKLALILFVILANVSFGQVTDTVRGFSGTCVKRYVHNLEITFTADSIFFSGVMRVNCGGEKWLIREINADMIKLTGFDSCLANCMCGYAFQTALGNSHLAQYTVILGYKCFDGTHYQYVDSVVRNPFVVIQDLENFQAFKLFPNPVNNQLIIETSGHTIAVNTVTIYNLQGGALIKNTIRDSNIGPIDVSRLPQGLYILEITTDDKPFYFKFSRSRF